MEDTFYKISKNVVLNNLINLKQLVFEVTDACNLHCKYCAYAELYEGYDLRQNKNMPFHKAKLIMDYLQELWERNSCRDMVKSVSISFYGNKPLHPYRMKKGTTL